MKMFVLTKKLIEIQNDMDIINSNRRNLHDIEKRLAALSSKTLELYKSIKNTTKHNSYGLKGREDDLINNELNEIRNELISIINTAAIYGLNKKKFNMKKPNIQKYLTYLLKFCTIQSKDLSKRQKKLAKRLNKLVPKELQKS